MVHQQLGHESEAKDWFKLALASMYFLVREDDDLSPKYRVAWQRVATLTLLRDEAESSVRNDG